MKNFNINELLELRIEFSMIKIKAEQSKINKKEALRALKLSKILKNKKNKELLNLYENNSDFRILTKGDL